MSEFEVSGQRYRACVLPVTEQWAMLQRLRDVLPALAGMDYGLRVEGAAVEDIAAALQPLLKAKDDDVITVFGMARAACEQMVDDAWCAIPVPPRLDILMRITTEVVAENFAALFAMKRAKFKPAVVDRPAFEPVEMPDGESWLWRPVLRGVFRGEGLYDGSLRIEHIAKANDALDCDAENDARARKAMEPRK